MKYIIKFSADNVSLEGKPLQEEIDKLLREKTFNSRMQIALLPDGSTKKELQIELEKIEADVKSNVRSLRKVEKDILDNILASKLKDTAKASEAYGAMDFADRIQNSESEIVFDDSDNTILQAAYEKATKQEAWYTTKLRSLMKQIMKPTEFKEP